MVSIIFIYKVEFVKYILIGFVLVTSLLSYDYALKPVKVGKKTYCFFGASEVMNKKNNGNMVNSCFIDMGDSYLVIDSGPTYKYAKQAHDKIKKIKDLPVSYVINTHVHDDHWLGNGYYDEIGVKIIGSDEFKNETKVVLTRMEQRISPQAYDGTEQVFPSLHVNKKRFLEVNNKKVHLIGVSNKAHTASDIVVYIPYEKIVFAGDLVFNDRAPSLRDGSIDGWLEALDMLRELDVEYIVGGHGKIVDRTSVDMTYNYIKTLKGRVSKLIDEGKGEAEVMDIVTMDEYKNVNLYHPMHKQNVQAAYMILEWAE